MVFDFGIAHAVPPIISHVEHVMQQCRRIVCIGRLANAVTGLALAATAGALVPGASQAQTVAHTTFGPGDSYGLNGISYLLATPTPPKPPVFNQILAVPFTFSGANASTLASLRFGVKFFDYQATGWEAAISFLHGASIANATSLESWTLTGPATVAQIFAVQSLAQPALVTGDQYWLKISAGPSGVLDGRWYRNDQGLNENIAFSLDQGVTWMQAVNIAPAWEVRVRAPIVTPEPATFGLVAVGVVLVGVAARRSSRRRIACYRSFIISGQ